MLSSRHVNLPNAGNALDFALFTIVFSNHAKAFAAEQRYCTHANEGGLDYSQKIARRRGRMW